VRIPADEDDQLADDAEVDALEKAPEEPVVFRHWDPEVLAVLLPLLLPEQMARLCGAANGLAYFSGHAAAPTVVAHNPVVMPSPQGQLGFTVVQMEMLSANRMTASRRAIASYLRETVPEDVNDLDDSALYAIIVEAEVSGNLIGLQSEHAHGLWAFLHVVTGGVSSRSPEIRQHFYKAADDPELVLRQLLDEVRAQAG
jgi:hypothetical protein